MSSEKTQQPVDAATPKRPGGRTAENSRRIHDATIELLVEGGFEAVTFQEIARRAGVGRATLYRRWDSPSMLIRDAVLDIVETEIFPVDTGTFHGDLVQLLRQIGRFISGTVGVAAMITTLSNPGAPRDMTVNPGIWVSRLEAIAPIFQRAIKRGELDPDQDVEALFASLAGALYFRIIVMTEPVDDAWIERVLKEAFRK
ncbi:MAG: TetR/AcrR family transcriptional regulator [Alphaproteobacteria bacterium]|nr:TetR/AcrR family transcriptional regulator [Alphaproteobacteria bacterium]